MIFSLNFSQNLSINLTKILVLLKLQNKHMETLMSQKWAQIKSKVVDTSNAEHVKKVHQAIYGPNFTEIHTLADFSELPE